MVDKFKKRKDSGFTIVEVMIVLAIAGLIILVVFLAVPALQRSARNTERNNDASLVGAAVNECLLNRNGRVQSCGQAGIDPYIDVSKLRQLTVVTVTTAPPDTTPTPNFTTVSIAYARKCAPDGSAALTAGATARSVALLYNTENASGGAVSRCQEV